MSKIIRGYVKLRWRNEINRYEFTWMYKRIRSITQSRQTTAFDFTHKSFTPNIRKRKSSDTSFNFHSVHTNSRAYTSDGFSRFRNNIYIANDRTNYAECLFIDELSKFFDWRLNALWLATLWKHETRVTSDSSRKFGDFFGESMIPVKELYQRRKIIWNRVFNCVPYH